MRRVITLVAIAALAFAALAATAAARTESRFSLVEIVKSAHRSGNTVVTHVKLVVPGDREVHVSWEAAWRGRPPLVEVAPGGCQPVRVDGG